MDDRVKEQMSERVAGCSTFWNPVRRCCTLGRVSSEWKVDNRGASECKPLLCIFRSRDDDVDDDDEDEDETRRAMIRWKGGEKIRGDEAEDSWFRNAVSSCLSTLHLCNSTRTSRHQDVLLSYRMEFSAQSYHTRPPETC